MTLRTDLCQGAQAYHVFGHTPCCISHDASRRLNKDPHKQTHTLPVAVTTLNSVCFTELIDTSSAHFHTNCSPLSSLTLPPPLTLPFSLSPATLFSLSFFFTSPSTVKYRNAPTAICVYRSLPWSKHDLQGLSFKGPTFLSICLGCLQKWQLKITGFAVAVHLDWLCTVKAERFRPGPATCPAYLELAG